MKFWFDTEFIEDGKTIDLISIGIVAEDGREFYAESREADISKASEWVRENVLPHLWSLQPVKPSENIWPCDGGRGGLMSRTEIAQDIVQFCDAQRYGNPEFWAYYADYDWVALCQLFGRMIDLPQGWPMYCRDLKQELDRRHEETTFYYVMPERGEGEHHALADAQWNKKVYDMLKPAVIDTLSTPKTRAEADAHWARHFYDKAQRLKGENERLRSKLDGAYPCSRDRLVEISGDTTTFEDAFRKLEIAAGALKYIEQLLADR